MENKTHRVWIYNLFEYKHKITHLSIDLNLTFLREREMKTMNENKKTQDRIEDIWQNFRKLDQCSSSNSNRLDRSERVLKRNEIVLETCVVI